MDTVHVTRVTGEGASRSVYGHATKHCDESGCNGSERYYPALTEHEAAIVGAVVPDDESNQAKSLGVREWAKECGGAALEWQTGTGDARLTGWIGADGTRAIETNGDPVWERDEGFDAAWESRAL